MVAAQTCTNIPALTVKSTDTNYRKIDFLLDVPSSAGYNIKVVDDMPMPTGLPGEPYDALRVEVILQSLIPNSTSFWL